MVFWLAMIFSRAPHSVRTLIALFWGDVLSFEENVGRSVGGLLEEGSLSREIRHVTVPIKLSQKLGTMKSHC